MIEWTAADQHEMLMRYYAFMQPVSEFADGGKQRVERAKLTVAVKSPSVTVESVRREIARDMFNVDPLAHRILDFAEQQAQHGYLGAWHHRARTLDGIRREYKRRERQNKKFINHRYLATNMDDDERIIHDAKMSADRRVKEHKCKHTSVANALAKAEEQAQMLADKIKRLTSEFKRTKTVYETAQADFNRAEKTQADFYNARKLSTAKPVEPDEPDEDDLIAAENPDNE